MNSNKTSRLSILFEKMVADSASVAERYELKVLYQEYINDGRDGAGLNASNSTQQLSAS